MKPAIKWIGGAAAAVALLVAGVAVASLALGDTKGDAPRLTADEVLDMKGLEHPEGAQSITEAIPAETQPAPADTPFVIKRVLPIEGPIKYGEWHWDEDGVPPGPLVMTVDLDARVISVFRGGYEIGAAAVMLGTDEHPTPLGRFPILSKERHNVSEKYNNAPMPWTLRLTWDGIAIHGGSEVLNGYASHGCIATPDDFQSKLFDVARKGDIVIITKGKRTGVGQSLTG